jgi:hypothetical protein
MRASEQIREDAEQALDDLTSAELWATPSGMTSAGFHAKHLAGSTQRLCTYLEGGQLTAEQVAAIAGEKSGPETAPDLLQAIHAAFERYEAIVRRLGPAHFGTIREIGRQRVPTTAVSLAIHIAEHGQRHVGQLISAAKLARASNG